jgi:hypothetical protein
MRKVMAIKLARILTISARDYCEMHGRKLNDYEAKGIHYTGSTWQKERGVTCWDLVNHVFLPLVPNEAEVVVDFRDSMGSDFHYSAHGTALIPKPETEEKD